MGVCQGLEPTAPLSSRQECKSVYSRWQWMGVLCHHAVGLFLHENVKKIYF